MNLLQIVWLNLSLFIFFLLELLAIVFGLRRTYASKTRLDGKVVVITGANSGIGKETAYQLSLRGAKVIIGCRDMKKAETAINDIKTKNPTADITPLKLDLASLKSVRQFAKSVLEQVSNIDILINNAGVAMCPEWKTEDGFELQFGTNHLGHFLLTLSLLPLLKRSLKARIINMSSVIHIRGKINFENINLRNGVYSPMEAYSQSKLANVLFIREIARRLGPNSNITTYSVHPGPVKTKIYRYFSKTVIFFGKTLFLSVFLGAQTTLYCALEESLDNETGHYYNDCKRVDNMVSKATDDETAQRLWDMSSDLVKLEEHLRI